MNGRIEVVCGPMYCGKTEELIRRLTRLKIAEQNFLVLRSEIDNRYSRDSIASHSGKTWKSTLISRSSSFNELTNGYSIVALDEAQFLDHGIVDELQRFAREGGRVIVAGLDMTYRQEPFGPMGAIMAIADSVTKFTAICHKCKNDDAVFTQRLIDGKPAPMDGDTIVVGGNDMYEARCRKCFRFQ